MSGLDQQQRASGFVDQQQLAEFWNQTVKDSEPDRQTGYLSEEWPAALALNRLRGELAQIGGWLDRDGIARGAYLDVGCGTGVWLEHFSKRFERCDGIDLSSEMVNMTNARMAKLGIANVHAETQSVLDLPDDRRYDFIFVGGVFIYLNDDEVAPIMAKLARMLNPGGMLVLRESTSKPDPWYRDTPLKPGLFADPNAPRPPYIAIYRRPTAYRELAEQQGLSVVRVEANRHYKFSDMTEGWLRWFDKLLGLKTNRRRAEKVARAVHAMRWITLAPWYHLIRLVAPRSFRIENHWYAARKPG